MLYVHNTYRKRTGLRVGSGSVPFQSVVSSSLSSYRILRIRRIPYSGFDQYRLRVVRSVYSALRHHIVRQRGVCYLIVTGALFRFLVGLVLELFQMVVPRYSIWFVSFEHFERVWFDFDVVVVCHGCMLLPITLKLIYFLFRYG